MEGLVKEVAEKLKQSPDKGDEWIRLLREQLIVTLEDLLETPLEHVIMRVAGVPLLALERIYREACASAKRTQIPHEGILTVVAEELKAGHGITAEAQQCAYNGLQLISLKPALHVEQQSFHQWIQHSDAKEASFCVSLMCAPTFCSQLAHVISLAAGQRFEAPPLSDAFKGVHIWRLPRVAQAGLDFICFEPAPWNATLPVNQKDAPPGPTKVEDMRVAEIRSKFPALACVAGNVVVFGGAFSKDEMPSMLQTVTCSVEDCVTLLERPHVVLVWVNCPLAEVRESETLTATLMRQYDESGAFQRLFQSVRCIAIPPAQVAPDAFHNSVLEVSEAILPRPRSPMWLTHMQHARLVSAAAQQMMRGRRATRLVHAHIRLLGLRSDPFWLQHLTEVFHSLLDCGVPFNEARSHCYDSLARAIAGLQLKPAAADISSWNQAFWEACNRVAPCTAAQVVALPGDPQHLVACGRTALEHVQWDCHRSSTRLPVEQLVENKTGALWWKSVSVRSRWAGEQYFYWSGDFEGDGATCASQLTRLEEAIVKKGNGGASVAAAASLQLALQAHNVPAAQLAPLGTHACASCLRFSDESSALHASSPVLIGFSQRGVFHVCSDCRGGGGK